MLAPVVNWNPHTVSGPPPDGEVYVWAFPLSASPERISNCAGLLSIDEVHRAEQFKMEHLRRRYIVAHGVVRKLLGGCLQRSAKELEFEFSTRGKPRLKNADVEFNLAHSDELGLLAVTRGTVVGVDVERIRPMPDGLDIAKRFFSAREVADFEPVVAEARDRAFFNLWTRKEAWLKATGDGIAESLSKVEFTFREGETVRVIAIGGDVNAAKQWSLFALEPTTGYTGALAIPAQNVRLSCWSAEA